MTNQLRSTFVHGFAEFRFHGAQNHLSILHAGEELIRERAIHSRSYRFSVDISTDANPPNYKHVAILYICRKTKTENQKPKTNRNHKPKNTRNFPVRFNCRFSMLPFVVKSFVPPSPRSSKSFGCFAEPNRSIFLSSPKNKSVYHIIFFFRFSV